MEQRPTYGDNLVALDIAFAVMPDSALHQSRVVILRHLAACRFWLPEFLPIGAAEEAEKQMVHFLHHYEFALALDEAEALGNCCDAPGQFWRELELAATEMNMEQEVARYAALQNS